MKLWTHAHVLSSTSRELRVETVRLASEWPKNLDISNRRTPPILLASRVV